MEAMYVTYTAICDLHKQWINLNSSVKKNKFCVNLTINDINPAVLARNAIIIGAFVRFGRCSKNIKDCDYHRNEETFCIVTLLEYTYFGYAMPPSVYDHQMSFIDEL